MDQSAGYKQIQSNNDKQNKTEICRPPLKRKNPLLIVRTKPHTREGESKSRNYKKQVSKEVHSPVDTVKLVNKFASHADMQKYVSSNTHIRNGLKRKFMT